MKKLVSPFILISAFLCISLSVFAQDKTISAQEFLSLKNAASEKLKNRAYRVKTNSESYRYLSGSAPSQFTNSISEHVPPDRRHYIYESKNNQGIFRRETISIGQKTYVRQNDGSWKELESGGNGIGSGGGTGVEIKSEVNVEYKYKGTEIIHNQKNNLYEVTTTRKFRMSSGETTSEITERFWFSQDGMFLKTESETKQNGKKIISRTKWEYEYDPNIKIEAPKLVEGSK